MTSLRELDLFEKKTALRKRPCPFKVCICNIILHRGWSYDNEENKINEFGQFANDHNCCNIIISSKIHHRTERHTSGEMYAWSFTGGPFVIQWGTVKRQIENRSFVLVPTVAFPYCCLYDVITLCIFTTFLETVFCQIYGFIFLYCSLTVIVYCTRVNEERSHLFFMIDVFFVVMILINLLVIQHYAVYAIISNCWNRWAFESSTRVVKDVIIKISTPDNGPSGRWSASLQNWVRNSIVLSFSHFIRNETQRLHANWLGFDKNQIPRTTPI